MTTENEARDYHGRWTAGGSDAQTMEGSQEHAAKAAGNYKPLVGLPQNPIHLADGWYTPGPNAKLKDAAAAYMKSAGLPYNPIQTYQHADPVQGAKIAQAFDQMKHDPNDPATKASYEALAKETMAQWQAIKATGLQVDWIKSGHADPYQDTPRAAEMDVSENNHWWGFPTDQGFGSDPNIKDNPMLRDSGEVIGGRHALVNDVFRIVHDMNGHIKEGNGFTPSGEDNAWRSHYAMYSPAARPAMTTETRGQSSWVNYGPHGASNRAMLYGSGTTTHTPSGVIYAPQKIGLLPDWVQEGAKDPS